MEKLPTQKGASLLKASPEIASEADGWNPEDFSFGVTNRMPWICSLGHKWVASIGSRTSNNSGCPICSNKKLLRGFNDLATVFPVIANEANGWDPTSVLKGSTKRFDWKCSEGHEWNVQLSSRISNNSFCPYCSGQLPIYGKTDLKTLFPHIAMEADGWNPEQVTSMSGLKRKWKCPIGHSYSTSVRTRTSNNSGCPICDGKKILEGFNDLATLYPQLALEADGWDPKEISGSTHKSFPWICHKGHKWQTSVNARTNAKTNCPYCSNKKVLQGFNDVATTNPHLAKEILDPSPKTITEFSHLVVSFQCEKGHIWKTRLANRKSGKRGCPTCAKSGFDPNMSGWIYFLRQDNWGFLQIGISNNPQVRVSQHSQFGWELIELLGPFDGQIVRDYERMLLKYLKKNGAYLGKMGKGLDERMFSGHTESWLESSFPLKSLKKLLAIVIALK